MDVRTFRQALRRRWYLLAAVLVLTLGATAFAVTSTGPSYKAEGSVLLFPPTATIRSGTTVETQGNPYLMLGGLSQARDIVIRSLTDGKAREDFEVSQPNADFEAVPDFTTSGPIILFIVKATTSDEAVAALDYVMDQVPPTLRELQSSLDLDESAYITSMSVTADQSASTVRKGQIRTGLVVGAGVLILGLLLIGLVDGLLLGRAARAADREEPEEQEKPDEPDAGATPTRGPIPTVPVEPARRPHADDPLEDGPRQLEAEADPSRSGTR